MVNAPSALRAFKESLDIQIPIGDDGQPNVVRRWGESTEVRWLLVPNNRGVGQAHPS